MHDSKKTAKTNPEPTCNDSPEWATTKRWTLEGVAYCERLGIQADQEGLYDACLEHSVNRLEAQLAILIQWALDADADPAVVAPLLDRETQLLVWDLAFESGLPGLSDQ